MGRTLAVLVALLLLLMLVAAVPIAAVAAPEFDFAVLGSFGGGADLGAALGVNIIKKPPGAFTGGLWADLGIIVVDDPAQPYLGVSTAVGPLRAGGGYEFGDGWRLVVLKAWAF